MSVGIVLAHGYSGSPSDLEQLAERLSVRYNRDSVTNVSLPGHYYGGSPVFDKQTFIDCISNAVNPYIKQKREIIILGHSTGGILALSFILERSFIPHLLILASVPRRIDSSYVERWKRHRSGKQEMPFGDVAKMISLINSAGSRQFSGKFPMLIVHGEQDELVPSDDALAWKQNFCGAVRSVVIPHAGHSLFRGENDAMAIDVVVRAISDITIANKPEDKKILDVLSDIEPDAKSFIEASPLSGRHLAECPGGQALIGNKPLLSSQAKGEPVLANIEITTRCNLKCVYCARSLWKRHSKDMAKKMFSRILDLLPHAYRITIVGLGEPLMHPHVVDFVAETASRGRRAAVVTNAMLLDEPMSYALIKAGLHSIAFSIDGPTQETASDVRTGSDMNEIICNIKTFMEISKSTRPLSTAVFAAVSKETALHMEQLVDLVKGLGVNILMLTDLNFAQNRMSAVCENKDEDIAATVRKALASAFSKKLPVLSVRGLEELGMAERYKKFLLLPPSELYRRSIKHTWCYSPWQTVPVDVEGNITICDCQPDKQIGNILTQPFSEIWNGEAMMEHRRQMLCDAPPEACGICPRF